MKFQLLIGFVAFAFSTMSATGQEKTAKEREHEVNVANALAELPVPLKQKFTYQSKLRNNPESVYERKHVIRRESLALNWFGSRIVKEVNGASQDIPIRSIVLKQIRASDEETKQLDALFKKRAEDHEENLKLLQGADRRETAIEALENGVPLTLRSTEASSLPVLPEKKIAELLVAFEEAERKAEKECIDRLAELIDPSQLKVFVHNYANHFDLYCPMVAKYLELSDEQVKLIKSRTIELWKLNNGNLKLSEKEEKTSKFYEQRLLICSVLTPEQLLLVKHLIPDWEKWRTFEQRLDQLQRSDEIRAKMELEILGDVYRTGAKLQ